MKKVFILFLTLILILTSSLVSFADSNTSKITTIKLDISTAKEDKEIIKKYKKIGNDLYSKKDNNIVMNINSVHESDNAVEISGDAVAKMFGKEYNFSFNQQQLDIKFIKNKKFYTGAFDVTIDENYSGIIDITTMSTFSKTIISFTLLDTHDESSQSFMMYGDTFKEQIELFDQELNIAIMQAEEHAPETTSFISSASANSNSAYQHVTNKSNSILGGVTRDKQMLVMNISKCDPVNFGSGANGFEMIRVFSRSYNAKNISYDSPILLAKPNHIKATFNGDPSKLMSISGTKPTNSSGVLTTVFQVFNSVIGSQGNGLLAAVSAIIGTLSIGVGDSVTVSGTNVVFDIDISDLEASSTDLPASTTSSNAETDTSHGISFKIGYLQDINIEKTASISVSSVLTYRLFFSDKRTVSLKTGAATVSHTINLI